MSAAPLQVQLAGWLADPALCAAAGLLPEGAPRAYPGWSLVDQGDFTPPGLGAAPGGAVMLLDARGTPNAVAQLRLALGAAWLGGREVLGVRSVPHAPAPDRAWHLSEAVRAPLMAALREFAQGDDPGSAAPRFTACLARASSALRAASAAHTAAQGRPASPDASRVQVLSQRPAHRGFFSMDHLHLRVPRFDGGLGAPITREVYLGIDAALVLPYDSARDAVLLVEQFRCGLWARNDPNPWALEPPAGLVDPGETPGQAALRELHEETGLHAREIIALPGGYASPGYSTDYFHCFAALCDFPQDSGWVGGEAEEDENIRSHLVPLDQALSWAGQGEIRVIPLISMLLWLARARAEGRLQPR